MDLGLDVTHEPDRTILTVAGEVDVATAPTLRERLVQLIADGNTRLTIDLTPVDFLDSTGLGVLVGTLKRIRQAEGELVLVIPQERIRRLFEITGLNKIFEIVDRVDDAKAP
jgi:anti-sigma B factor antagonist